VSALQWVVNAYTLAFAALILSAGALSDRVGAKRVFIAGFSVFTVASAICGLAPTLGVPSAALSAGPLVGGVLTATLGWRAIFFINAPVGMAGIFLTSRHASETSRSPGRGVADFDPAAQLTAILCLTLLAAATIRGGADGFGSTTVLAGYAAAAVAGVAFLVIEARGARPMLPLRLFRCPSFGANTAIGLLINVAFYGLIFVFSLFFQRAQHFSALQAGLAFAPMTGAIMAANAVAGGLQQRFGARAVIAGGALLMAAGAVALEGDGPHTAFAALVAQLIALGFGL